MSQFEPLPEDAIVYLPDREDDLAKAERLAGLLANKSHLVWQPE